MKNKIQVHYNAPQYEASLTALKDNVIRYRKLLDAIEQITDSRQYQTLEQIENYIKTKTTFSNIILSAGLLDVLDSYTYIKSNHLAVNFDVLDINGDIITTKESVLAQIKEDATEYLKDELIDEYKLLEQVCIALNKLPNVNSSNFIKKTYDSVFSVNLHMLQNKGRI